MKKLTLILLLIGMVVAFNTEARRISDDSKVQTISALSMEVDARIQAIMANKFEKAFLQMQCGTWYSTGPGFAQQSCSDNNNNTSITRNAVMFNGVPAVYSVTYCYQGGSCQTYYP